MGRTGATTHPPHYGKSPKWLFSRMSPFSREIVLAITGEFGPKELPRPDFRSLLVPGAWVRPGIRLALERRDYHRDGALQDGMRGLEGELGVFLAGGKGAASRKTPARIREYSDLSGADPEHLVYASRMSAKVDNTAVHDGCQLYHHVIAFAKTCEWAVVQQGMNEENQWGQVTGKKGNPAPDRIPSDS